MIGAQNIDIFAKTKEEYTLHDSNIASITLAYGGVGRNLTENIKRLGNDVSFLTVFGDDTFSIQARESLHKLGIDTVHSLTVKNSSNSIYLGILNEDNDLYLGLNDMDITQSLNTSFFKRHIDYINSFNYIVIDNNLNQDAITYLCTTIDSPIIMDAVSAKKVHKLRSLLSKIDTLKLNTIELSELSNQPDIKSQMIELRNNGLNNVLVTDGKNEIRLLNNNYYEVLPTQIDDIVNASGAGDAFLSGFIQGVIENVKDEEKLRYANILAHYTLLCNEATSKEINKDVLK